LVTFFIKILHYFNYIFFQCRGITAISYSERGLKISYRLSTYDNLFLSVKTYAPLYWRFRAALRGLKLGFNRIQIVSRHTITNTV
jgi:hypothetical protein